MMPFAGGPRTGWVEDLEIASHRREPSDRAESAGRNVGAAWSRRDDSAIQESDSGETLTDPYERITSAQPRVRRSVLISRWRRLFRRRPPTASVAERRRSPIRRSTITSVVGPANMLCRLS